MKSLDEIASAFLKSANEILPVRGFKFSLTPVSSTKTDLVMKKNDQSEIIHISSFVGISVEHTTDPWPGDLVKRRRVNLTFTSHEPEYERLIQQIANQMERPIHDIRDPCFRWKR